MKRESFMSSPFHTHLNKNGIVERKNRTLIEAARTMLEEYKILDHFSANAINTACHAINRLYLHKILNKTVYELLLGKKPNVSYFRFFGSKYFILNKKPKNSKFASKVCNIHVIRI
jgi:hypothetical protein